MYLLPLALLLATNDAIEVAQPNADDVHSQVSGPSTICGVTASDARSFQLAVRDSAHYSLLSENEDYYVVISDDKMTIWAFSMPNSAEPPSAICTRLERTADGIINGNFGMRCDGEKADCDEVYGEWFDYHRRVTLSRVKAGPKVSAAIE
jgi:hypothetical protein